MLDDKGLRMIKLLPLRLSGDGAQVIGFNLIEQLLVDFRTHEEAACCKVMQCTHDCQADLDRCSVS